MSEPNSWFVSVVKICKVIEIDWSLRLHWRVIGPLHDARNVVTVLARLGLVVDSDGFLLESGVLLRDEDSEDVHNDNEDAKVDGFIHIYYDWNKINVLLLSQRQFTDFINRVIFCLKRYILVFLKNDCRKTIKNYSFNSKSHLTIKWY